MTLETRSEHAEFESVPRPRSPRLRRAGRWIRRSPKAPLFLLGALMLVSAGARFVWLDNNRTNVLIFDEAYYVNAARTILGIPVPRGYAYVGSPAGIDPNAEHPPLAKLAIAGSMKVFGDNPYGWRLPSLVMGTAAIAALYWLVRSAGGGKWLALGAAGVMVADNLALVHGGIATLDVFVLVFMLVGVSLYLRNHPVLAGVALGVGACTKTVAFYAFVALLILELLRVRWHPHDLALPGARDIRRAASVFLTCSAVGVVSYLGVLGALDRAVTNFDDPVTHTSYMFGYHTRPLDGSTSGAGNFVPPSKPWEWLVNQKPLVYYDLPSDPGNLATRPVVLFQGRMSPFVIWLAVPAFGLAVWNAVRRRDTVSQLVVAWCIGTFTPFVLLSGEHISYIYYMLVVLPGVYVGLAELFSGRYLPRVFTAGYTCALLYGFVAFYPFRG